GTVSLIDPEHQRLGGIGDKVAHSIQEMTGKETRSLVLGHLQRGGSPTTFDRLLGLRFGAAAVRVIADGKFGTMVALRPPTIAPTRAACETIELAFGLNIDTLLAREHGADIDRLAASGRGFGIVAGTGTGKTLAIRSIAQTILRAPLKVGVVNREREATPETPTWNVVIVTTGIARRWFEDGLITARDTLVVDEIHQTSAELRSE